MQRLTHPTNTEMVVDFHPTFLNQEEADYLYWCLIQIMPPSPTGPGKRTSMFFGDPGKIYTIQIKDSSFDRETIPWEHFPYLLTIRDKLTAITGVYYSVVAIQCYPTGKAQIKPHRDKEMTDKSISGVSVGAPRKFVVERYGEKLEFLTHHGSLYIMQWPTNNRCVHHVPQDLSVLGTRYSLTFRSA